MDLFGTSLPGDPAGDRMAPEPGQPPPPARAPRAADSLHLGDDWDTPPEHGRSRRWLLVAAVVPWLLLAAILLGGRGGPAAPASGSAPTPGAAPSAPGVVAASPSSATTSGASSPSEPSPTEVAAPPRLRTVSSTGGPSTRGRAIGLAVTVVRSWLSSRPAGVAIEGLEPARGADQRYVEQVTVESVDFPARGALVVTLRAVVLPIEGDAYGAARQVRIAVPVTLDAHRVRLAGTPWRLPVGAVEAEPPTTRPVDDPDLLAAAASAVVAAGYRDVALSRLERTSGWAWVAHVEARAPGRDAVAPHAIWLRSDVGRLVVAGTAAPPGRAWTRSVPDPSPSPSGSAR